ncbi:MAG: SCO family protein [Stellaceae bacterium]
MTPRFRLILGAALGLLILGGAATTSLLVAYRSGDAIVATSALGGPFALTTADGSVVTDRSYPGKWLLVYFGYTFCPDACPTALSNIAGALAKLGSAADKLQVLFITVDPRRDTPKVMGDYVRVFDPRIVGLSGSAEQIAAVVKEYKVYVSAHSGEGSGYLVDHSSFLYVMNPQGKFARLLSSETPADGIAAELRPLLEAKDRS